MNIRKLLGNRRGNVMVEFAIGAGVLTTLFTGAFQYGYTFYRYNSLLAAVNAGARYASVRAYDSLNSTPKASFLSAVQNMVVYGNPNGGSSPVVPGLSPSNVNLTVTFSNGVPSAMAVNITGYTLPAIFGDISFTKKPAVTYPYQGLYSPYAASLP